MPLCWSLAASFVPAIHLLACVVLDNRHDPRKQSVTRACMEVVLDENTVPALRRMASSLHTIVNPEPCTVCRNIYLMRDACAQDLVVAMVVSGLDTAPDNIRRRTQQPKPGKEATD